MSRLLYYGEANVNKGFAYAFMKLFFSKKKRKEPINIK